MIKKSFVQKRNNFSTHFRMNPNVEIPMNPWAVGNVDQFLFYNCPECELKEQDRNLFIQHAMETHPKAIQYLVKSELTNDELNNENSTYDVDPSELVDAVVKEEGHFKVKQEQGDYTDYADMDGYADYTDYDQEMGSYADYDNNVNHYPGDFDESMIQGEPSSGGLDPGGEEKGGSHACETCGKTFQKVGFLARHIRKIHSDVKMLSCDVCMAVFQSLKTLKEHSETCQGPFKCDKCEEVFEKMKQLKKHEAKAHAEKRTCHLCGKSFAHPHSLRVHLKKHEGSEKFECKLCNKTFSEKRSLEIHHKGIHLGVKDYVCNYCGQAFAQKYPMLDHVRRIHEGKKDVKCKLCPEGFQSVRYLDYHYVAVHNGYYFNKCIECDKTFKKHGVLMQHM